METSGVNFVQAGAATKNATPGPLTGIENATLRLQWTFQLSWLELSTSIAGSVPSGSLQLHISQLLEVKSEKCIKNLH